MRMQIRAAICLTILAVAGMLGQASIHAQQSTGTQSGNASKQSDKGKQKSAITQAHDAKGSGGSDLKVRQEFGPQNVSKPSEQSTTANPPGQSGAQGSGNSSTPTSKHVSHQEFGPTQANKKNDVIVPSGSNGQGGKPQPADPKSKKDSPK